jgi:hypothetical protein
MNFTFTDTLIYFNADNINDLKENLGFENICNIVNSALYIFEFYLKVKYGDKRVYEFFENAEIKSILKNLPTLNSLINRLRDDLRLNPINVLPDSRIMGKVLFKCVFLTMKLQVN